VVCYYAVALKNMLHWTTHWMSGRHGVGGPWASFCWCLCRQGVQSGGQNGLLLGNHWFFIKQWLRRSSRPLGIWLTLGMLKVIDWITPVKVQRR